MSKCRRGLRKKHCRQRERRKMKESTPSTKEETMPYYEIRIKQVFADGVGKFEVVYNPGTETEFTEPVEFFALCDLLGKSCQGEGEQQLDDFIGVILPVTCCDEEGLEAILTSDYKLPSEQEVRLRKKPLQ